MYGKTEAGWKTDPAWLLHSEQSSLISYEGKGSAVLAHSLQTWNGSETSKGLSRLTNSRSEIGFPPKDFC